MQAGYEVKDLRQFQLTYQFAVYFMMRGTLIIMQVSLGKMVVETVLVYFKVLFRKSSGVKPQSTQNTSSFYRCTDPPQCPKILIQYRNFG
jgi:hypothetical protein